MTDTKDIVWIKTTPMADLLGCDRKTLGRLKTAGYLSEGQHYRKVNPLSPRGCFVWHRNRVLLKMKAL